jgi:Superinfection immunity protein
LGRQLRNARVQRTGTDLCERAQIWRRKGARRNILIVNVLTGWTFLGWTASLVWACAQDAPTDPGRLT